MNNNEDADGVEQNKQQRSSSALSPNEKRRIIEQMEYIIRDPAYLYDFVTTFSSSFFKSLDPKSSIILTETFNKLTRTFVTTASSPLDAIELLEKCFNAAIYLKESMNKSFRLDDRITRSVADYYLVQNKYACLFLSIEF